MDNLFGLWCSGVCSKCGYQALSGRGSLQAKLVNGKLVHIKCPTQRVMTNKDKVRMKRCPKCDTLKQGDAFYPSKRRKDGKYWCCKDCHKADMHQVYLVRRDRKLRIAQGLPVVITELKRKRKRHIAGKPTSQIYWQLKYRSKGNGLISRENFERWYDIQPKTCYYCDIPEDLLGLLVSHTPLHHKPKRLSIDRKDPNSDYIEENMVLACYVCNMAKSNIFDDIEMRKISQTYIKPKWQGKVGDKTIKEVIEDEQD